MTDPSDADLWARLERETRPPTFPTPDVTTIMVRGEAWRRKGRRRSQVLSGGVVLMVAAVGATLGLSLRTEHRTTDQPRVLATVAGHTISYLPDHPYAVVLGSRGCNQLVSVTAACWAPAQDVQPISGQAAPSAVKLQVSFGPVSVYTAQAALVASGQTAPLVGSPTHVQGAPAVLLTGAGQVQIYWQLDSTTSVTVLAQNIDVGQVRRFAEGIR